MKRAILIVISLLSAAMPVFAQSPSDPDEGSRMTYDSANQIYIFSWWGRSGMSYFIKHSDDLVTWTYHPYIVQVLQEGSTSIYFQSNASRYFLRLEIEADPFNTDSDGDGMPDGWEVLNGLNPRFNDAGLDYDGDGFTNVEEYALGLNPWVNEYGDGTRTQIYTYDNASRVTGVSSSLGETFTYDNEGNLTKSQ